MQRALCVVTLLVLCGACPSGTDRAPAGAAVQPRAIVLVTVDGLVAEELSAFGGPRATPVLAELARTGNAWPGAWTTTPMTRPAAATYLTGLAADRHAVTDDLFIGLASDVPTLASELGAGGYRSAAFPDSSFLGPASGLLRGFEATGDTPPVPTQPWRWLPYLRPTDELVEDYESWLATLPSGSRCFAWFHFSQPLTDRLHAVVQPFVNARRKKAKNPPPPTPVGIENVDRALGSVVESLRARGDFDDALIVVAGTLGDASGGATDPPGAGFSLAERAIRVPVVLKLPRGQRSPRPAEASVWAPDVAATIAAAAGVRLGAGAEGVSLAERAPEDRVRIAWTWALRDQLGLAPARVGSAGGASVFEGPATAEPQAVGSTGDTQRIADVLASRPWPEPLRIPAKAARDLLAESGIRVPPEAPQPVVLDAAQRREVAQALLLARALLKRGQARPALDAFRAAFELAPDLPATRLDFGQALVMSASGRAEALAVLRRGVELQPTDPEMLHWYAHALWSDSWAESEKVLRAILPYKPNEGDVLYDLACTRSLAGDLDGSVEFLRRAIEAGFRTWGLMETDPDLRALRASGRFAEVLKEYRK